MTITPSQTIMEGREEAHFPSRIPALEEVDSGENTIKKYASSTL